MLYIIFSHSCLVEQIEKNNLNTASVVTTVYCMFNMYNTTNSLLNDIIALANWN